MHDAVMFEIPEPGIAVITINRPAIHNALGKEVRDGLFAGWKRFNADPDLMVAILTGAGDKAFCAGGDLKEMSRLRLTVPPRDMFPILGDTIEVAKPTIAAVNGLALAGGFLMAQSCDLCVASTNAKFAITEVKVGRGAPWAPPLIQMLPQRIMMELLLTGGMLAAERAYELGLVNRLTEPGGAVAGAMEYARTIVQNAPLSVLAGKETVRLAAEMGRSAALQAARHAWDRAYRSQDAQEGPKAFAEKRKPMWRGE